jgi:hypothetical protein
MPPPDLELQCDNASAVLPIIQEKNSNIGDIFNFPCKNINLNKCYGIYMGYNFRQVSNLKHHLSVMAMCRFIYMPITMLKLAD